MTTGLVSAPWATPTDVETWAPDRPAPAGGWEPWLAQASDILYQLSGRQYRGAAQSRVQIVPAGVDPGWGPLAPGWVPIPADPLGGWGTEARRGRQLTVVALPSSPVISIDEVLVGGGATAEQGSEPTLLDPATYRLRDRAGHLERLHPAGWPTDGGLLITFTHGIAPPLSGQHAAATLAVELAAAATGDGTSRIANTATVTREGVTLAAVNLRDALTSGYTGLAEVDLWLSSINPKKLARRGSAWSPDFGTATRTIPAPSPYPTHLAMTLAARATPAHPTPTTGDVQRRLGRRRARRAAPAEE